MSKMGQIMYDVQDFSSEHAGMNLSDYTALARERLSEYAVEAAVAEWHKFYEEWSEFMQVEESK